MITIRFDHVGGPEVLTVADVDVGMPGRGEVRVRHTAIGVNYIDTYHRSGLYPLPLPSGLELEAAGIVTAVGPDVRDIAIGTRIAYCWGPPGAYATERLMPADRIVVLPESVDDRLAAAVLLKGCTTEFLVERCARVIAGQTVLVHAAAGGVGQLLVQWLREAGARVLATVGSAAKMAIAREAGADEVIDTGEGDFAEAVAELTHGNGVDVVFDGVGRATWNGSLASLRRRGLLVSFGNASGPVEAVDLGILARQGSLFVTRPTLFDYCVTLEERRSSAAAVFARVADGRLKVSIGQEFGLTAAAEAHRALESRSTTGSTILLP